MITAEEAARVTNDEFLDNLLEQSILSAAEKGCNNTIVSLASMNVSMYDVKDYLYSLGYYAEILDYRDMRIQW